MYLFQQIKVVVPVQKTSKNLFPFTFIYIYAHISVPKLLLALRYRYTSACTPESNPREEVQGTHTGTP